jgi:hypothetical protein
MGAGTDMGSVVLNIATGGLAGVAKGFDRVAKGGDFGTELKRGVLSGLTVGTSEIATGGGEHGDEVLADKIFPTFVNDWALDDREKERKGKADAAAAEIAAVEASKPGRLPDLTDETLESLRRKQRTRAGTNRASTFLTGQAPSKTFLGG